MTYSATVVTRDEIKALQINIERELDRYHTESAQLEQVLSMHTRRHAHTHLVACDLLSMRWMTVQMISLTHTGADIHANGRPKSERYSQPNCRHL